VVRLADGATVCDIKRNLFGFHHSFVVKDGREYLITGRSYMSQTIVDLDRGAEYEPEGDHYDGHAFCWTDCFLSPDGHTLAVEGCIWAAPYEIRFFDFTDPAAGWPALPIAGADWLEDPSNESQVAVARCSHVRVQSELRARRARTHHARTARRSDGGCTRNALITQTRCTTRRRRTRSLCFRSGPLWTSLADFG